CSSNLLRGVQVEVNHRLPVLGDDPGCSSHCSPSEWVGWPGHRPGRNSRQARSSAGLRSAADQRRRVDLARVVQQVPGLVRVHRRSEEHTSELQSRENLVCRLLLEKKKKTSRQAGRNSTTT